MPENITIKDIARALNLSVSTVSRALEGNSRISVKTTLKVKEYAEKHHYRPNLSARNLRSNKSRSIGISLTSVHNTFYANVLNGMESVAAENSYHVIITQCHESQHKEAENIEHLMWRGVDGFLISLSCETTDLSNIANIIHAGTPVVFFDRIPGAALGHTVISDNVGGSYELTKHLIQKGHRRIAHVTSTPGLSITKERLAGYKKALVEFGIEPDDTLVKYCSHGGMLTEEIKNAVDSLLSLPLPPQAITTASDRITIGCFSLLRKRGLKIPGDIALTGFSNFSDPDLFDPPLTTVSQQAFEMGKQAMTLLIKQLKTKRPVSDFETITLPTNLEIRNST